MTNYDITNFNYLKDDKTFVALLTESSKKMISWLITMLYNPIYIEKGTNELKIKLGVTFSLFWLAFTDKEGWIGF